MTRQTVAKAASQIAGAKPTNQSPPFLNGAPCIICARKPLPKGDALHEWNVERYDHYARDFPDALAAWDHEKTRRLWLGDTWDRVNPSKDAFIQTVESMIKRNRA